MNPILSHAIAALAGAVVAFTLEYIYDHVIAHAAEELENLTAEEAQAFADVFSNIAKRLKTPGK